MKMTPANANQAWPAANAVDVIDHAFTMDHHDRQAVTHEAERLADPRRQALPPGPMLVVATKGGLYGRMHEPGERFVLKNGQTDFSFNWMKPVTGVVTEDVDEKPTVKGTADHDVLGQDNPFSGLVV